MELCPTTDVLLIFRAPSNKTLMFLLIGTIALLSYMFLMCGAHITITDVLKVLSFSLFIKFECALLSCIFF